MRDGREDGIGVYDDQTAFIWHGNDYITNSLAKS